MNVTKMIALELERLVVAAEDATQDALATTIGRMLEIRHRLLKRPVAFRKALDDGFGVRRTSRDVIV